MFEIQNSVFRNSEFGPKKKILPKTEYSASAEYSAYVECSFSQTQKSLFGRTLNSMLLNYRTGSSTPYQISRGS